MHEPLDQDRVTSANSATRPRRGRLATKQRNMERPPRKRRRPALSCFECRRRKIRCDRTGPPCKQCSSSLAECVYKRYIHDPDPESPLVDVSSSGAAALPVTPRPCANSCYSPENHDGGRSVNQTAGLTASSPTSQPGAASSTGCPSKSSSNVVASPNGSARPVPDLRRQVLPERPSDPPLQAGLDESGWHILKQHVGLKDTDVALNKRRPPRWSEWLGTAPEFALIYGCYAAAGVGDVSVASTSFVDAETAPLIPRISELLQTARRAALKIKASRPSRSSLQFAAADLVPPSRNVADAMVKLYFQYFESTYRIVHRPSFYKEYEQFWTSPDAAGSNLRLKVLLVVAIGASVHESIDTDPTLHRTVSQWISAAQDWLLAPMEKNRLNITGIQIHCLAFLARQIYSPSADMVWTSVGTLINTAFQLALHRDPKHMAGTSRLEAELRRRLWATILEMEMQTSLDTARPVRIRLDDFDTEAPLNIDDEDIDENSTDIGARPRTQYTHTCLQLLLIDTVSIRLRILQLLHGLHCKFLYVDALALGTELTNSHRTFGKFVHHNSATALNAFHRNLVDFFVCRFLIPLHGPFVSKARSNPIFHYSRKISVDAAMAIVSSEPSEEYYRLLTLGGNLLREGLRCAMTVINLELVMQADCDRLDGTLNRPSPFTEVLKKAVKDMLVLTEEQIKKYETNVKVHTVLVSTLALVDASFLGASAKTKVAQAAIDSLEHCLGLLQTVIDSISQGPSPASTDFDSMPALDLGFADWDLGWNMTLMNGFWGQPDAMK